MMDRITSEEALAIAAIAATIYTVTMHEARNADDQRKLRLDAVNQAVALYFVAKGHELR